jgi:hypothetical protein
LTDCLEDIVIFGRRDAVRHLAPPYSLMGFDSMTPMSQVLSVQSKMAVSSILTPPWLW